jgi:hypothetical protein
VTVLRIIAAVQPVIATGYARKSSRGLVGNFIASGSTDWFRSPQREAQRLLAAIEDACRGNADEAKSAPTIEISQASSDSANHISTAVPDVSGIENNLRSTLLNTARSPEPYKEFKLKVPPQIDLFEIGKKELGIGVKSCRE